MMVMPADNSGWFVHCLARETGKIGQLRSPTPSFKQTFPWLPYALDNGAFSCWDRQTNVFDTAKWAIKEQEWRRMIFWATTQEQQPLWAIVPDHIVNSPLFKLQAFSMVWMVSK